MTDPIATRPVQRRGRPNPDDDEPDDGEAPALVAADPRRPGAVERAAWPLAVVAVVVIVNFPALIGLVDVNPLGPFGMTALHIGAGYLPGQWSIDPNIGYTAQALGHRAALDWLHGIVPWWNPYEGLGTPLAVGQSAALFPPTLLLALPQGQLLFHMTLEASAGIATWFLVREVGLGPPVATLGGILFALDGTLAWFGSAGANPVAFLPLFLLGVERLARREGRDPAGLLIVAAAVALSIYSGFPEIAYVDGLLAGVWFVFRLAGRPAGGRARYLGRVTAGVGMGLLLAAPFIVAFADYLPLADVGVHAGSVRSTHLSSTSAPIIGLPYLYGPLTAFVSHDKTGRLAYFFGQGGGYLTGTTIGLGLTGLFVGRQQRGLRIVLAVVAALFMLWAFDVGPLQHLLGRFVPLTGQVDVAKYCDAAVEMSFVLLACFGVDAVAKRRDWLTRAVVAASGLAALALLGVVLLIAAPEVRGLWRATGYYRPYAVLMVIWAGGMLVVATLVAVFSGRRVTGVIVATLLAVDAAVMFGLPQLSAPRSVTVDMGPVDYLAAHLGNGRFFSLGIYEPNYGSYFSLSSLDVNDLPVPKLWVSYVDDVLASNADPLVFNGRLRTAGTPTVAQDVIDNIEAFEAVDVRYVVTPAALRPFGGGPSFVDGIRLAYKDSFAAIYALPDAVPFFTTSDGSCRLRPDGLAAVTATCARGVTLQRSELDMAGWSATVNGKSAEVDEYGAGLQSVQLPAGTSTVDFAYEPPHIDLAVGAFAAGMLAVVGVLFGGRLRYRRRRPAAAAGGAPADR